MSAPLPPLPPASPASEFQHAQELLNGFLNSQGSLTRQNVEEAAQKCISDISNSFCKEAFLQYPNEINQIFQDAAEKIRLVVSRVMTRAAQKRPLEEGSFPVEAKRPKISVPSEVYNGFLHLFGDEEKTKCFCSRLSRTAIDFLGQTGRMWPSSPQIPSHMRYAECYKRLFLPITLDVSAINEELVNDYAELATHLSLYEETRNNLFPIMTKLMSLSFFPLIKKLYPNEPPYEAMKRILSREIARNAVLWSQILSTDISQWENSVYLLSLAGGASQRLASLDSLPFDLSKLSLQINRFFASLPDDQLSTLSSTFSAFSELTLPRDLFASSKEITRTIRRCLEDSRLFDYFNLASEECNPVSDDSLEAVVSWFFRTDDQEPLPPTCPLCTRFPWTKEEVLSIINAYGRWASPLRFWDAEMTGRIEEELSCATLGSVPREILLRFLGSKPFPIVKAWLETPIETPSGRQARLLTLSATQREDILCRFRGDDDFFLPSPGWRELLHATEEESRELCDREEPAAISTAEQYQRSIVAALDPHDPISLIRLLGGGGDMGALVEGLMNAQVESICHRRTFLTWGKAEAGSSACVAQDAPPLYIKDGDAVFPIYPGDAFSELSFGTAAVSLRRRLIAFKQSNFGEFSRIIQGRQPIRDLSSSEGIELFMELYRLQDHFRAKFIPSSLSQGDEELVQITFRDRLKQLYREEDNRSGLTLDPDTALYKNSLLFLSLIRLAREAKVFQKTKGSIVEFGYGISFYIHSLKDAARPRLEDNPGIVHFQEWSSGYSRGNITPITPQNSNPSGFLRLISAVQNLTDEQYGAVRTASLRLAVSHIDEYQSTEEYFEEWKKMVQEVAPGLSIDAAWAIIPITKNYLPSMSFASHKSEPSGIYQVTDDPNEFCPEAEVPLWLPYSNFSGAICASFIPHEPERHDGNCGVNSFLLGLHGPTAYEGDHRRNLPEDIVKFRQDVVSYAREHEVKLKEEFGKGAIDEIIAKYARIPVWTGAEVWNIAARVYGREIRLISEETHMGIFRRENSTIVPFDEGDVFLPQGEPKGPPIYLVFFGQVHYANLEPKAAPGHV